MRFMKKNPTKLSPLTSSRSQEACHTISSSKSWRRFIEETLEDFSLHFSSG
jgi:hypothetical protein